MFLLGEYYEDEARDIADRLKKVGMKVEIRTFTASRMELLYFLEGRMSTIKGKMKESTFKRYERYLDPCERLWQKGPDLTTSGRDFF